MWCYSHSFQGNCKEFALTCERLAFTLSLVYASHLLQHWIIGIIYYSVCPIRSSTTEEGEVYSDTSLKQLIANQTR